MKKYNRALSKVIQSSGYIQKRSKTHYIFENEHGQQVVTAKTPKVQELAIKRVIKQIAKNKLLLLLA